MKKNVVRDKSFAFAIRVVNLQKYLVEEKREFTLSKQLLRSGTSVGAMVCEAEQAESRADFKHKLNIGLKEINESIFWLRLLHATEYLSTQEFKSLYADAHEIIKMLTAIIKSLRETKLN